MAFDELLNELDRRREQALRMGGNERLAKRKAAGVLNARERIDYLFWNHDRHAGNQAAMRAYLLWETELPAEITRDGLTGFRIEAG